MDCEKFETAMIDELYDELDELTSAAAKRHVGGCARCAAMYSGLRATRRVLSSAGGFPLVEMPGTLEARILAATREAQKVVPLRRRMASVISAAGSWAMRPQTQMAAVFLLMIGSSVVFLKGGRKASPSAASAPMTVTEQGAPAASFAAAGQGGREESLDTPAANAAHGAKKAAEPAPAAVAMATATAAALPEAESQGLMDGLTKGEGRADKAGALGNLGLDDESKSKDQRRAATSRGGLDPSNAGAIGGAGAYGGYSYGAGPGGGARPSTAPPPPPPLARTAPARPSVIVDRDDPYGNNAPAKTAAGPAATAAPAPPALSPPADLAQDASRDAKKKDDPAAAAAFEAARAAYVARNFDGATRQFDALALGGDGTSALWAARSVRDGSGCGAATSRYDVVAGRQAGSGNGNDALLEGGQCYRQLGQFEAARARLVRLLTVSSHAARAQRELDAMSPRTSPKPQPRKAPEPSQQQAPPQAAPQAAPAPPRDSAF